MNENQLWLLRFLSQQRTGGFDGLPVRAGITDRQMDLDIADLSDRRFVRVQGPPNLNAALGRDVERLHLTPVGRDALRASR